MSEPSSFWLSEDMANWLFGLSLCLRACQGGVSFQAFMQLTAKSTFFNDNFAASKINIEIKAGGGFGETKST